MESDSTYIFQMCIPCGKTLSLIPRSRSSVKVKYQGHIFQKKAVTGALVFHKHRMFSALSKEKLSVFESHLFDDF